jgi:hypothetical protein
MRSALCLYGHFRTFTACWPSLCENLITPNKISDVFMMAWADSMGFFQHPESSKDPKSHRGYDTNSPVPASDYITDVCKKLQPHSVELPLFSAYEKKFESVLHDLNNWHHPSLHHRPKGTLGQVWGRCNSIRLKREYEEQNRIKFDYVVVTRYDIAYSQPINLEQFSRDCMITDGMYGSDVISDAWCSGPSNLIDLWGRQFADISNLVENHSMNLGPHEWLMSHFNLHRIPWIAQNVGISICR